MARYEDYLLSEDYYVGLGFPQQGFVFFRVLFKEYFDRLYDRILTDGAPQTAGQISANEYLQSFLMKNGQGDSILDVRDPEHLYHLFWGVSPSALRVYPYLPPQTARHSPDVETIVTRAKWGFIDGFESGFADPSTRTQMFLPETRNLFAVAIWNPLTVPITDPLLWFVGAEYTVEILKDPALVGALLNGGKPCRFATIGGAKDSVDYDAKREWQVNFVTPGMSPTQIAAALSGR